MVCIIKNLFLLKNICSFFYFLLLSNQILRDEAFINFVSLSPEMMIKKEFFVLIGLCDGPDD